MDEGDWFSKDDDKRRAVKEKYQAIIKALTAEISIAAGERTMLGVAKGERGESKIDIVEEILIDEQKQQAGARSR